MVGEKSKGKRWGWVVGALIAVLVAVAFSSAAPKIALFGSSNKPCNCTQVWSFVALLNWVLVRIVFWSMHCVIWELGSGKVLIFISYGGVIMFVCVGWQ